MRKDDDDGIDTSASDADDEDDEMNDGCFPSYHPRRPFPTYHPLTTVPY